MEFVIQSEKLEDYLEHQDGLIDFNHPLVQAKITEIESSARSEEEKAKLAFNYVRDEIQHSFDTQSKVISISASETIGNKEGICFAKAHLLAALLRGMGIPTGFCYQRVTRKGTKESGHALHGLNAVYLADEEKWIRVDPRGNKAGIYSEFNVENEVLAYPIRNDLNEIDYPYIFACPLNTVIDSMKHSEDCHELFYRRPEEINVAK